MNKFRHIVSDVRLWLFFAMFFLTNLGFLTLFYFTLPPQRTDEVKVHVAPGSSLQEITDTLEARGLIRSGLAFRALTRLRGLETGLRAGDYTIPPDTGPWRIIGILTTGQGEMDRFTVPEGLTELETVQRISGVLTGLDSTRLLALARSDSFAAALGFDVPGLRGYLFPDTYFVPPTINEEEVLRLMTERFRQVYNDLLAGRGEPGTGLDRHRTVILASIVEKEAVLDRERPVISSVFLNRLELGRPLESCATVLFVLGKHKSRLLYRDLEVESPYNTYLHRGLPPGPICNPGRASLEAALYPDDTNYLYFVARGDGSHSFSRSLRDHLNAKRRFRRYGPGSGGG